MRLSGADERRFASPSCSCHQVCLDEGEVDVFSKTRLIGKVDIAVFVHGIDKRVQILEAVIILEEGMQEASFVPLGILAAGGDDQVRAPLP